MRCGLLGLALMACAATGGCGADAEEGARAAALKAEAHCRIGRWDAAAQQYEQAIRLDPFALRTNYGYAHLLAARMGHYARARILFRRAASLDPGGGVGRRAAGWAEACGRVVDGRLERPEAAVESILRAVGAGSLRMLAPRVSGSYVVKLRAEDRTLEEELARLRGRLQAQDRRVTQRVFDGEFCRVRTRMQDSTDAPVLEVCLVADGDGLWKLSWIGFVEEGVPS